MSRNRPERRPGVVASAAALLVALVIATGAAGGGGGPAGPRAAGAAGADHHAAVIVEANGTVVQRVVTFTADSISGIDALQSAGFTPVLRGFSGLGAAVCAIDVPQHGPVVGCPSDNSCLTCAAPDYWAYFEAAAGTSTFQMSRAGASSTRVHDGGVEGWRWGTGDPPPYASVASLTPPAPQPSQGNPSSPVAPSAGGRSPAVAPPPTSPSGSPPGLTPSSTAPVTGPPGGAPAAGAPATTPAGSSVAGAATSTSAAAVTPRVAASRTSRRGSGGGGGSPIGPVAFGVVAAALAGAIVLARRARARHP
ncbi:MAG: hypothetical protein JOZ99_14495 [Actinobacteria bacterium]|nr:hypothetical protein [Actinomycetota bacterium]